MSIEEGRAEAIRKLEIELFFLQRRELDILCLLRDLGVDRFPEN